MKLTDEQCTHDQGIDQREILSTEPVCLDLEQRNGRAVRQHNTLNTNQFYSYFFADRSSQTPTRACAPVRRRRTS